MSAQTVVVADEGSTLRITDGNTQTDLFKYLINCRTSDDGLGVVIEYRNHSAIRYDAGQFLTPSGSAKSIQNQISAMLYIH